MMIMGTLPRCLNVASARASSPTRSGRGDDSGAWPPNPRTMRGNNESGALVRKSSHCACTRAPQRAHASRTTNVLPTPCSPVIHTMG